jgi:hypothetical protein
MRFGRVLVAAALLCPHSGAHDVITTPITFAREISRLLYSRCAGCHRPGGSAFSLLTYEAARPWAKAIKEEVLERRMPPWGAVKGFGEFHNDRGLTQEQLELIAEWVEGGAPEGDPRLLPRTPDFTPGARQPAPRGIAVEGSLTLKRDLALTGIRARNVAEKSSLMVIARRPDGSTEPLLWLYQYNRRYAHPYWYTVALRLPAGSTVEVQPPGAGSIELLTGRR